jgi:hypothetical protein
MTTRACEVSGGAVKYTTEYIIFLATAFAVAAACLIAVVVIAVRHRRKTGSWPYELTHMDDSPVCQCVFWMIIMVRFGLFSPLGNGIDRSMPAALVFAGLDLSMALAMLVVAGLVMVVSFTCDWSRHTALRQTYFLMFAFLLCGMVVRDIYLYRPFAWIWIIAAVEAAFLTPVLARLAYVEYYQRYMEPPEKESENASKIVLPPY